MAILLKSSLPTQQCTSVFDDWQFL